MAKFVAVYWENTGGLYSVGRDIARDRDGNPRLHKGLTWREYDDTEIPFENAERIRRNIQWHPRDRAFAPVSPPAPEPEPPTIDDVLTELGERPTAADIEAIIETRVAARLSDIETCVAALEEIQTTLAAVREDVKSIRERGGTMAQGGA